MNDTIIFFLYIIAGSMGLVGIIQILILMYYGNTGNRGLFRSICLFMICTAAIDFLYLGYDYYRLRTGHYDSTAILRILDIELFIFQPYFLCSYMRVKSHLPADPNRKLAQTSSVIAAVCASIGLITYGLMMHGYYEANSRIWGTITALGECFINISMSALLLYHLGIARGAIVQKESRLLVTIVAISSFLNNVVNSILSVSISTGHYLYILEYELDLTPVFLLIINVAAVILIIREDFSSLFQNTAVPITAAAQDPEENSAAFVPEQTGDSRPTDPVPPDTAQLSAPGTALQDDPETNRKVRLDHIAEKHFLTVREREVLELCYNGMTNPEIADALFISMNTVKRHLHNIFEKMDVSTRIELVHMVNNSRPG